MAPSRSLSFQALAFGSTKRNMSPGPPSPTFSDATHASAMNFGVDGPRKIITRANLKASLLSYEELMNSCSNYRAALVTMSKATASFADAMERCSGLKGPTYETGTRLQAASGVHHLIGNLWHVLAETLDKSFEKPLRQHLDTYRTIVNDRSSAYERALREKSQIIRDTELRSMTRKERNLQNFREALAVLQRQVDDLDDLKASHYQEIIEHEEEVWDVVQGKVCVAVRSTMDVFDRITAKASDPIIEPMLQSVPDPFDSYGPPQSEDQIFSILAPLSIMTSTPSSSTSPITGTPERVTIQSLPSTGSMSKIASWLPNTPGNGFSTETTEWAESPSSTPRSVSPPSVLSRRHSLPSGRKSDSKLRSVLTVIEESRPRSEEISPPPTLTRTQAQATSIENQLQPDPAPDLGWNFTYGQSPYDDGRGDGDTTPRHSSLFSSHLPPAEPPSTDRRDSDEQAHASLLS